MSQREAVTHPFRSRFPGVACLLVMVSIGVLGLSRPAAAQFGPAPSYGAATNIPVGTNPLTVAVADVNKDGKLDLVIPSNAAGGILVMLGDGNGGFTATGPVIPTGVFPEAAAVADLNGDTFPDIVVSHFGPPTTVAVLLGNGTGAFTPALGSPLTPGTTAFGVAIARINGDAFPDIVVANRDTNNVSVFLGTGTGAFGAASNFAVGLGPQAVAVADLNNDGFNDIIATNYNQNAPTVDNVSVLLSLGGGGFAPAANYTTGAGARTLAITDLNGDGRPDVVVANGGNDTLSVLIGNANGTLQNAVNYPVIPGGAAFGVSVGDFNVDGKMDVAVANGNLTSVALFTGNGAGVLQAAVPTLVAGTNTGFIGVGDFNGDGKPDLAVSNVGGGNASIFLNTLALSADLGITKVKASPATVVAGQNIVYTTTVSNAGPNSAVLTQVADVTPAGLTFMSNAGACTTPFPCALGTLNPGGAAQVITSTFLVGAAFPATSLSNTATASSGATDPTPASATATTPVTFSADLSITKVKASPATVVAGQQVVYTITVTNAGPSNAAAVQVTDTPGAGLTFVSNAGACTTAFPCTLGASMAPGTQVITSTYLVQASAGASITNTANVASTGGTPTPDPNAANNTSVVTTPVTFSADLSVTKVKTSPATVVAGQNVVYTITVTNAGPSNAAAVQVTDTPGAGLTFVSNAGACTTAFPCTLGATMAPGSQVITSTYLVQASAGASITNTANVASTGGTPTPDPNAANNQSAVTTPVTFSADLSITKVGPAIVTAGQDVVYTITVTNNGPSDAAAVRVTDATPAGLTFVSNSGGGCVGTFPCNIGTVVQGTPRVITSTFNVPLNFAGANTSNTASVASAAATPTPDPNNANNSATATTPVGPASADLKITKVGPAKVFRGTQVVYTITVTNLGGTGANAVQVADPTPAGLNFVSNTGDCATAFPCNLGGLANGASRTITATFDIPTDYAGPEPVVNTATVSSTTTDPVASNNSASASASLDKVLFNTVPPCRVLDTRLVGPALAAGTTRSFTITGNCTVPSTARSVSVNITVTGPTDAGDLNIYPTGSSRPAASVINYVAGETRANNAVIPLGTAGALDVFCEQATGTVDFILDVNGYFEP